MLISQVILILSIFGGVLGVSFVNSKLILPKNPESFKSPRLIRSAGDEQQAGAVNPVVDAAESAVLEKIRRGLTRLRHAEDRLKQFVDKIEMGIETKKPKSDDNDKIGEEMVDFHKLVAAYKDVSSQSFSELTKRISDDTHILLDQLQGRLDETGHLIKDKAHDAADKSAEDHH